MRNKSINTFIGSFSHIFIRKKREKPLNCSMWWFLWCTEKGYIFTIHCSFNTHTHTQKIDANRQYGFNWKRGTKVLASPFDRRIIWRWCYNHFISDHSDHFFSLIFYSLSLSLCNIFITLCLRHNSVLLRVCVWVYMRWNYGRLLSFSIVWQFFERFFRFCALCVVYMLFTFCRTIIPKRRFKTHSTCVMCAHIMSFFFYSNTHLCIPISTEICCWQSPQVDVNMIMNVKM